MKKLFVIFICLFTFCSKEEQKESSIIDPKDIEFVDEMAVAYSGIIDSVVIQYINYNRQYMVDSVEYKREQNRLNYDIKTLLLNIYDNKKSFELKMVSMLILAEIYVQYADGKIITSPENIKPLIDFFGKERLPKR